MTGRETGSDTGPVVPQQLPAFHLRQCLAHVADLAYTLTQFRNCIPLQQQSGICPSTVLEGRPEYATSDFFSGLFCSCTSTVRAKAACASVVLWSMQTL